MSAVYNRSMDTLTHLLWERTLNIAMVLLHAFFKYLMCACHCSHWSNITPRNLCSLTKSILLLLMVRTGSCCNPLFLMKLHCCFNCYLESMVSIPLIYVVYGLLPNRQVVSYALAISKNIAISRFRVAKAFIIPASIWLTRPTSYAFFWIRIGAVICYCIQDNLSTEY